MFLNTSPLRYGWAIFVLLWLSVLFLKLLHLWHASSSIGAYISGIAPEMLLASINLIAYILIHRRFRTWSAIPLKWALTIFALLMCVATLSSFYVFFVTGQLPRFQQLEGLSWDLMGASIVPMLQGIKGQIIMAVISLIALLWLLEKYLSRLLDKYYLGFFSSILFLPLLVLAFNPCPDNTKTCPSPQGVLAWSLLENDIEEMDLQHAKQVEQDFFDDYRQKLAATTGLHPDYQTIYPLLKGKNVILLVLESVRHKEIPLHGGEAYMPFLQSLRDQSIVFDNVYSQDIRSTKAYAALDMGMFSLLSWDSYTNHLTKQFTNKSLPYQLKQLGYSSYSYTSGSATYDRHKEFQVYRDYDETVYVDWDDEHLLARMNKRFANIETPFYMQVWPMATHHPYTRDFWQNRDQWLKDHPEGIKHGQPEDFERYLQALTDTDDFLERMVKQLKKHGLYENTVIIGIGDHGEAFGEHNKGNVFHGNNVYEESVHVAAFLHSPLLSQAQHENRFFSSKDIIASIFHLANSPDQVVFNDGRSIFNQYQNDLPIYLYNSWSKYLGIIWQGQKLRYKDTPINTPMYFSSINAIRTDLNQESRMVQAGDDYLQHKQLLNDWSQAMKALSYRRLYANKRHDQLSPFQDVLRVYCDDGNGFREEHKDQVPITARLNNQLIIQPDKHCQALRITFLWDYTFPADTKMRANLKSLQLSTPSAILQMQDLTLTRLFASERLSQQNFKLQGKSASFDVKISDTPVMLHKVHIDVDFLESKAE